MGMDELKKAEVMKSLMLGLSRFDKSQPDTNTEFPTSDAVRFQALLRGECQGLGLESSGAQADILGQIMWSWQRKSRAEFEHSLIGVANFEEQQRVRYGVLGSFQDSIEADKRGKE